jgi:hypothetical protein
MIKKVLGKTAKALGCIRVDLKQSNSFLLILLSPAFIFGQLIYSSGLDYQPFLTILTLAALSLLGSKCGKSIWYCPLAILTYGTFSKISPLSLFALPFFLYAVWHSGSALFIRRISVGIFLVIALFSAALKIQLGEFNIHSYIQPSQFYAGFVLLLILALTPLFFIRLNASQRWFYGFGFFSVFALIGFGFDWGCCIHLYVSLIFVTLIFGNKTITYTPAVSRISIFVVVIFALLWNIPAPFLGLPGFGLYGAIYKHFPVLNMEDPLKHPFWREAGERYSNIRVGVLRNNLPPDSEKLRFLLGRVGMKNITFVDDLNSDLKAQAPNSNTLYLLSDWRFSPSLRFAPDISVDLLARIDGYLVYAPGWKVCKDCREIAKDLQIDSLPPKLVNNGLISFADGQPGVQLLGEGWSKAEAWGAWSDKATATLFLPKQNLGSKKLVLNLRAFVFAAHPKQIVRLLLDDKVMGTFTLEKGEGNIIALDLAPTRNNFYKIEFNLENPIRPVDLRFNKDQRLLGIGLVSLRYW